MTAILTPNHLPAFTRTTVSDLIDRARSTASLHVIAAPPGAGKSTQAREHILQLIQTGQVRRVLWAVQATLTEHSLGKEAEQHFRELDPHLDVQIIYGHQHPPLARRRNVYLQQFWWPTDPAVRIISHAHLPLVFGGVTPHAQLTDALDLLVVDEDPMSALLLDSRAESQDSAKRMIDLAMLSAGTSLISRVLTDLLTAAQDGRLSGHTFASIQRVPRGVGLYGQRFWEELTARLAGQRPSAADFQRDLKPLKTVAALVANGFIDDLAAFDAGQVSQRFGLHWLPANAKSPAYTLRYNLRRPFAAQCATVILDGYAHDGLYQRLFSPAPVQMHHFAPTTPLQVEYAPELRVWAEDDFSGPESKEGAAGHRQQIADELVHLRRAGRRQLVLTSKAASFDDNRWGHRLKFTFEKAGYQSAQDLVQGYWFNSRGVNHFKGCDVVALTQPRSPKEQLEYSLSALEPYDAARREEFKVHLEWAEALQMLNRGRQPQLSGPDKPRIVCAFALDASHALLKDRVVITAYQAKHHFKKYSKNPRLLDAMGAISEELLEALGGVPRIALIGAGLIAANSDREKDACRRVDALARTCAPTSHLRRCATFALPWMYDDVQPAKDSNRAQEKAVMARLQLLTFKVPAGQRGAPTSVYALTQADAERALTQFLAITPSDPWQLERLGRCRQDDPGRRTLLLGTP